MDNNKKIIIEIAGLVIAIIACVATWLALPQVQRILGLSKATDVVLLQYPIEQVTIVQPTYTFLPTYTSLPTSTPTPNPTSTPTVRADPTNTIPAIPTDLPTSTPPLAVVGAALPDTPAGSVLKVGETWTTGGLSVQLESLKFCCGDEADLWFVFTNNTGKTLFFHLNENMNITMQDDKGKFYTWNSLYEEDVILENGESMKEQVFKLGNFSGVNYLVVTLNLPNLIYAQWRYN